MFSLNSENLVTKIFVIQKARACYLLYKRPGCYHSGSKTHVRDWIFKSNLNYSLNSLNSIKNRKNSNDAIFVHCEKAKWCLEVNLLWKHLGRLNELKIFFWNVKRFGICCQWRIQDFPDEAPTLNMGFKFCSS